MSVPRAGAATIGRRPSTLNLSGDPRQLALSIGPDGCARQLLVDPGATAATGAAERDALDATAATLLARVGASDQTSDVLARLADAAPRRDPDLLAADGGIAWFGIGQAPGTGRRRAKIYLNQQWGRPERRWGRLAGFADSLGAGPAWAAVAGEVGGLSPSGVSLDVVAGAPATGRLYLAGTGRPAAYWVGLTDAVAGPEAADRVQVWLRAVLAADWAYPTRSVCFSVAVRGDAVVDVKVELCAHCAFDDQRTAGRRTSAGLRALGLDDAGFTTLHRRLPGLVYLGCGSGGRASCYFDPGHVVVERSA